VGPESSRILLGEIVLEGVGRRCLAKADQAQPGPVFTTPMQ